MKTSRGQYEKSLNWKTQNIGTGASNSYSVYVQCDCGLPEEEFKILIQTVW